MSNSPSKQPSPFFKNLLKEQAAAKCSTSDQPDDDPIVTRQGTALVSVARKMSDIKEPAKEPFNEGGVKVRILILFCLILLNHHLLQVPYPFPALLDFNNIIILNKVIMNLAVVVVLCLKKKQEFKTCQKVVKKLKMMTMMNA
jgi:hypothetical protein